MYGYRYTPAGRVFELPGADLTDAIAEVHQRRQTQAGNHNPPTVELVERVGDRWQWRPLPEVAPVTAAAPKHPPRPARMPKPQPLHRQHRAARR